MSNKKGFTLVEILIVVIILGILAAIVVPQFADASDDAKLSNLKSNLQTVRAQLELYRLQHGGNNYPTTVAQLTSRTNLAGTAMPADGDSADYPYGPYLQQMPANPFATVAADASTWTEFGWTYSSSTGSFAASTSGYTSY